MKREILLLAFALMCILWGSCISFKIKPLWPPENQVEQILLCKEIDDSGELLKPIEIQSEYIPKDNHIICLVRIKDVAEDILLRWKWYSPDKKMARDTRNVIINRDQKYLEVVTAYDIFELNPKVNIEGQWTVAVFLDDRLIGTHIFHVKPLKKT